MNRKYLYDFGVSQDDTLSELRALELISGDRVLCIASAGEVPLELLVNSDQSITIDAVDIAPSQLMLSNLKLQAALALDTEEAARFLGYLTSNKESRKNGFSKPKRTCRSMRFSFGRIIPKYLRMVLFIWEGMKPISLFLPRWDECYSEENIKSLDFSNAKVFMSRKPISIHNCGPDC